MGVKLVFHTEAGTEAEGLRTLAVPKIYSSTVMYFHYLAPTCFYLTAIFRELTPILLKVTGKEKK